LVAKSRSSNNSDDTYTNIPLDQLTVSDSNVRRRDIIADVDELSKNIEKHELQQPIVVQPADGGKYEIVIGQRRYLAYKQLRKPTIPAKVVSRLDPLTATVLSFSENVQRRDLAPRDKAEACLYMLHELKSIRAVAEELGISELTVRKWVGYAGVPEELKSRVEEGKITRGQASRIWHAVSEVNQAVVISDLIAEEQPAKEERERIFTAAEELPDQPIATIRRRAKELENQLDISFVLPEKWTKLIVQAADESDREPSDIARDATIEWLQVHLLFADRQ
jgi:ParB family chromosome partitioning protein